MMMTNVASKRCMCCVFVFLYQLCTTKQRGLDAKGQCQLRLLLFVVQQTHGGEQGRC